ncbi:MAG: endopeptidase La [Syntrophaceae bacterium]
MGWMRNFFGKAAPPVAGEPVPDRYPEILAVLPLKDAVLMPGSILPLLVSNPISITLIKDFHARGELFLTAGMKKPKEIHLATWDNVYRIGCVAKIIKVADNEDGDVSIMVKGIKKAVLVDKVADEPALKARVSYTEEDLEPTREVHALAHSTIQTIDHLARLSYHNMDTILSNLAKIRDPVTLLNTSSTTLPIPIEKKQQILEAGTITEKYTILYHCLQEELDILEISSRITERAKGEINHAQREYYLRQQLKAIRKELGDAGDGDNEIEDLSKEIEEKNLPEDVKKDVDRDIKRIARMQPGSAEYVTIRTYLDWILDLPWQEQSEDNLDIAAVEQILNEDHFDLKRPKKRIMEFLSVKKLKGDLKGPILCFAGPPGVGKTSLGRSIARAMGRKFVRISLGGVRDEAEIRGHRRTYIGAMPGRIIGGMKNAGTLNPVFMLDEIDKLTHDIHGDPASALLEALDPEQNNHFTDHYLNVPYDLSQVFFITTANVVDNIPPALKDRMEIVEIEGYTQEDKLAIAKNFLIPKEIEANGLAGRIITFLDEAVIHIIRHYTRESGVRNLQREIASVLRVIAANVARGVCETCAIDRAFIEEALGPIRFIPEAKERTRIPGIATGLAWTPFGGEILYIESAVVEGKDEMILTGQMGDVMKESARIALSLLKGMGQTIPSAKGLHIHVPAGAIPKDGPSAGITMVSSIYSLLTGRVVREDVAMTGEITLRGVVLPVGGIKEKVLAARRAGFTRIILPRLNAKDLKDIESDALKDMEFTFVDHIDEVLACAFPNPPESAALPPHLSDPQNAETKLRV